MKKFILTLLVLIGGFVHGKAEGYDRVSISLSSLVLDANEDFAGKSYDEDEPDMGLGGVGIDYVHGFPIVQNLYLEAGANLNFQSGSGDDGRVYNADGDWAKLTESYRNFNLQVPLDLAYHIKISDKVSLVPFIGVNFRLNMIYKMKLAVKSSLAQYRDESKWVDLLSSSEENMGSSSLTWNRFQIGLTCGFGFNINKIYVGLNGIVDFIPAFGYSEGDYKPKINSQNVKLSVGYIF